MTWKGLTTGDLEHFDQVKWKKVQKQKYSIHPVKHSGGIIILQPCFFFSRTGTVVIKIEGIVDF